MPFNDPWSDDPYGDDDEGPSFEETWGHPDEPLNDDPWADTRPRATESTTDDNEETSVTESNRPIAVANDGEIVVTFKQHGGFDSPWIVVHAADVPSAKDRLRELVATDFGTAVAKVAELFAATKAAGAAQGRPQMSQPAPRQAAPAQPSSGGDGRSCHHGTMVFREGTNKFDKPYKAYFCPSPKGTPDQCKATFL